jgi:gamma-glutamyltranspeptidase
VRHINNHPLTVHLTNNLLTKLGDTTVLLFITTRRHQAPIIITELHNAYTPMMINLNHIDIIFSERAKQAYALGSIRGARIFPSVLLAVVNIIDHQMSPQQAVEAPRI